MQQKDMKMIVDPKMVLSDSTGRMNLLMEILLSVHELLQIIKSENYLQNKICFILSM